LHERLQVFIGFGKKYTEWHKSVFSEGPFDKKTKELIALAAGSIIHCAYCIDSHSQKARAAGATPEEIAKVVEIAAIVGAGSTISYGLDGLEAGE